MENQANIVVVIVIGSLIMFLLALLIIVFAVTYSKRMKEKETLFQLSIKNNELELLRGVIDAQDAEREKIAASLHDEIGPLLTVLKLNITKHSRALDKQALRVEDLQEERAFIDSIITNVRNISHDLTPHFVKNNGLSYSLTNFSAAISEPSIQIFSEIDDRSVLNKTLTINSYRIVLELLNNIMKHDKPSEIIVSLSLEYDVFNINVKHDGQGISQQEYLSFLNEHTSSGLGLNSINSRLLIHNGTILYSQEQNHSQINLQFPLK